MGGSGVLSGASWRVAAVAAALAAAASGAGAQVLTGGAVAATPASSTVPTPMLVAQAPAAPGSCAGISPYDNYACLDAYLGDGFFERLYNYYRLEWGQPGPPSDPNAPPARIADWPRTPETTPPMPFTEWPYGGTTSLGVTRTGSADSPLMVALSNTGVGNWLNSTGIQVYGWLDVGANISNESVRPGGNAPISYTYTPNTIQLDQAVIYIDRFPDTVQTDHIDWGMRLSALYGENYRYTTAYGILSNQLLKNNSVNGVDFPMVYGELYIPQVMHGLMLRVGRFISLPDIEAQLAPNNYMYTHSLSYSFDNYTNEGIQSTLAVTKDLFLQFGLTDGTEAGIFHLNSRLNNLMPGNPIFPGATFPQDPGLQLSYTGCIRYNWNDGWDDINACADSINNGNWGYNNLQWYGFTAYHKWNDQWHISFELYDEHENNVPNIDNPTAAAIVAGGGTPFSPQFIPFNAPNAAHCGAEGSLTCYAHATGVVSYINYSPEPLDNFSLRPEFYGDWQGQRTGVKARYLGLGLGWQHWLSPQIEFRPEIDYYRSLGANAFNGDANAGIAPDRNWIVIGAMDMILHF
ncbi:MAG TPA: outer membrane beta-barrel protein [Stellaceae bacterium]|nr:outer membrane beta-barrel protein [Stellaceae bacterium]